jgi:Phage protein Gp138 N-terminal domain
MLIAERWEDRLHHAKSTQERLQSRIWTMLPCYVVSVDTSREHVTVQPTISGMVKVQDANGNYSWQSQDFPTLSMVPIKWPSGGNWVMTFPIAKGDEGTVHFASRCIDNWWVGGGSQPALASNGAGSLRMHDLSDGFYIPGGSSKPNFLNPVPSATSFQVRDKGGQNVISFDANTGFSITMPGGFLKLDTSGNLTVSGEITAGSGTTNQVGLQTHKTSEVQGGTGISGAPVPGT